MKTRMSVCLSGLPDLPVFDAASEPATLAQRWLSWKEEFELYVTASGLAIPHKKELYCFVSLGIK